MKRLFLDDVRNPIDCSLYMRPANIYLEDWDVVRTYNEFIDYITKNGVPDEISFDHDLADEHYNPSMYESKEKYGKKSESFREKTGYDCAKWLAEYCIKNIIPMPKCYVHSMNPVGRENIQSVLNSLDKMLSKVI
jgi:hypothetical protein